MSTSSPVMSRRLLLRAALAGMLPLSVSGCLGQICPEDPSESGGIDWTPDVLHPVFWGFQDLDMPDGAPGPLRIWYPTYEGFTSGPPILKLCFVRWPVVLFLHGQPPCLAAADYYKQWSMIGATFARSGYVVVAPSHAAELPQDSNSPAIQYAIDVIDWVRNGWEHAEWVDARAEATAVAGHSYGALLAARVALNRPNTSAYIGMSGRWSDLTQAATVVQSLNMPSFFWWATGNAVTGVFENMDDLGLWNLVPGPKYGADFPGEHFDYLGPLSACSFPLGDCTLVRAVAAELSTLFVSRYVPVNLSNADIPVSLKPPDVTLTQKQKFFAGELLNGLTQIKTKAGCRINLRWEDGSQQGSRQLGP